MASKRQRVGKSTSEGSISAASAEALAQSSDATYTRPKTRQRVQKAPPPLTVPNITEDAAERKRVLNVLAQRRYRERKRQGRTQPIRGQYQPTPDSDAQHRGGDSSANAVNVDDSQAEVPTMDPVNCSVPSSTHTTTAPMDIKSQGAVPLFNMDFSTPLSPGMFDLSDSTLDELAAQAGGVSDLLLGDLGTQFPLEDGTSAPITTPSSNLPFTIDPSALMNSTYSSSSSGSSMIHSSSYPPSGASSVLAASPPSDSYLLPVSELTLLKAFLRISTRLGNTGSLWDLGANSPFCPDRSSVGPNSVNECGGSGPDISLLPPTWQPTSSQRMVPHHPILDFLPWPEARNRVIDVFNLPESVRPPVASGPLALVEFAYDVEDGAEGMRIWGSDPYDPKGWEVGQLLFERWWFIFDRDIIEQSNRWRALRGASALVMKGPGTRAGPASGFAMEI